MSAAELQALAHEVEEVIQRVTAGEAFAQEEFGALALRIANTQRQVNPLLKAFWRDWDFSPASPWKNIRPLPVEAFKEYDVSCIPEHERSRVFYSSGTTAQKRSCHWHHAHSLRLYEKSLKPWFARHVLGETQPPPGRKWFLGSLTPPETAAPHSSLVCMLTTVMKEWGCEDSRFWGKTTAEGEWTLELPAVVAELEQRCLQSQPLVLLGTAFNFVHLLDFLQQTGKTMALPAGSRLMETGGYKGKSREMSRQELHDHLQKCLGVPRAAIIREYGMCELGSQAYDRQAGAPDASPQGFQFPPWAQVRVVSPETGMDCPPGEPGLLCIYDLANVWSALAIQTSDLAVRTDQGFELLGRAPSAGPRGCSLMVRE